MTSKDADVVESSTSEFEQKEEEPFSGKKSSCGMKEANRIAATVTTTDAAHVTSGQPVIDVSVIRTSASTTTTAAAAASAPNQHQQVATSTAGTAVDHDSQTLPPVAPPRYHRTSSHNSVSKGSSSRMLDQESRLGNKGTSQHEDRALQETMLHNGGSGGSNGKQSVKQMLRQRHPALLLQPVRSDPHTILKCMPSPPQTAVTAATTMHAYPSGSHIMPSLKTPASSLMPSTFWTGNRYPSESEFDTTRLEAYISSFATRSALLSSSHQHQHQQQQQYLQQQHAHRGLRRSSKSHNNRSKSVDRSVKLMNGNISQALNHQRQLHMIMPTVARYHNHPYHDHQHHNNQDHKHSLSKIISSLRNVGLHSSSNSSNRALIVSRSESLNSSDPESGSTSGDNETDTPLNSIKSPSIHFMDPPKSALKKSSSNSFPVSSSSSSSKNVTFSAFATVQMVDR